MSSPVNWYTINPTVDITYTYISGIGIPSPTIAHIPVPVYGVVKTKNNNFVITSRYTKNWKNWRMNFREFIEDISAGK